MTARDLRHSRSEFHPQHLGVTLENVEIPGLSHALTTPLGAVRQLP